jgi:hypothetical protein
LPKCASALANDYLEAKIQTTIQRSSAGAANDLKHDLAGA